MVALLLFLNLAFGQATRIVPDRFSDGKTIDVSIISKAKADQLFKDLRELPNVSFQFPFEGCYARATSMARYAEKQGVQFAKVYVHGTLRVPTQSKMFPYVNWNWHVAPVAYVTDHGKTELMVFDPSLFSKPVTLQEFRDKMTPAETPKGYRKTEITDLYFGSRYQYMSKTDDKFPKSGWDFKDLNKAELLQKVYLEQSKMWTKWVGAEALYSAPLAPTFPKPKYGVFPPDSTAKDANGTK